ALTKAEPDPLRPADEIQPVVGLELSRVLQKAMALNASDRYESASEFRDALRTASKDLQVSESGVVAESAGPEQQPVTHAELVIEGCVAAVTPVNVFYFVRKFRDIAVARQAVDLLLDSFTVCPLTAAVLRAAQALPISDYEDAVQHASGTAVGVEAIVTRNVD